MNETRRQLVQALNDACAREQSLVPVLESQIAMAPGGRYRKALAAHLDETRDHARRVEERATALRERDNVFVAGIRLLENAFGQGLALGRVPLDLLDRGPLERLRGSGSPEKVLSDAKTACATEALEIATYTGIEALAESIDDRPTAKMAASIRAEEQKMLEHLLGELPSLVCWAADAAARGKPAVSIAANSAVKARAPRAKATRTKRSSKKPARTSTPAKDEAQAVQGAAESSDWSAPGADLPIAEPETITAERIVAKLATGASAGSDERGGDPLHEPIPQRPDRITGITAQEPANR
jgi:ferritin-like metal-binding protein YciE